MAAEISVADGAARAVDVSGGDAVRVTSDVVSVSSASLEAASEAITVTTEQVEVSGGDSRSRPALPRWIPMGDCVRPAPGCPCRPCSKVRDALGA